MYMPCVSVGSTVCNIMQEDILRDVQGDMLVCSDLQGDMLIYTVMCRGIC